MQNIMKGNFKIKEDGKTISNLDSKLDENNNLIFKKNDDEKEISAEEFDETKIKSQNHSIRMYF